MIKESEGLVYFPNKIQIYEGIEIHTEAITGKTLSFNSLQIIYIFLCY